jgi:hypothetical protein
MGSWAALRTRADRPQHFQYPTTCCAAAHRGFVPIAGISPITCSITSPAMASSVGTSIPSALAVSDRSATNRSLLCSRQAVVAAEEWAEEAAHYCFPVAAQVFFIHRRSVRLSSFRFYSDLGSQQHGCAKTSVNVAITESLFQNGKGGLAGAVNRGDIAHSSCHAEKPRCW